jgi:membrane fusion protein, multidrug efflux system
VTQAEAALKFATDENTRYQDLVQKGAGTVQRAQQASSDFNGKQAALDAANAAKVSAERQIDVLNAQKVGAAAQLDQSKAQKDRADADLQRTELRATVDGRVTKLTAAVGALAAPGQAIMIVVPLDIWVTANFKESQLADMRVDQPVDIRIDAFGGRSFSGQVNSVQAGSGTAFSLLPAENATGNYVKVVQRVPVKITFNQRPDVELGPGMSVVPTVTVRP